MSKVILITGASSGLGEVMASYLVKQGHIVYGSSRHIEHQQKSFKTINMDVANQESVYKAIDKGS